MSEKEIASAPSVGMIHMQLAEVLGKASNYEMTERALRAHEKSLEVLDKAKEASPHQVLSLDAHRATARCARMGRWSRQTSAMRH